MVFERDDRSRHRRNQRNRVRHAVVEELAGLGAAVHTCTRKEEGLGECLKKWEGLGFRVTGSVCDLSVREQREDLLKKVSSIFDGKLNILINNVGTNIRKPTSDYTAEEFSFLMATNFESAFHMCQLAHPLLKASGKGSIVFISSVCGVVSVDGGAIYAASKGAMNQITKKLACEWAKDNIRVNSVSPWYIKTSLIDKKRNSLTSWIKAIQVFSNRMPVLKITNHLRESETLELQWQGGGNIMGENANSRDKRWSLNRATTLVTGGNKGIGHAIVEDLAQSGATVHTCSRNEAELEKCLEEAGLPCHWIMYLHELSGRN